MSGTLFNNLINNLAQQKEIDAVVLGGSRATGMNGQDSDYDVYIYLNRPLATQRREEILSRYCSYMEINNTFWETEDDCILNSGVCIELIYRTLEDLENQLRGVMEEHTASCGYTTCVCHNVFSSKILYDPFGRYQKLVKAYSRPYPELLRSNIIEKNRKLLGGTIPAYLAQIEKAVNREDFVSVQHRITEFLASYFDIVFAYNRVYHPGEKRLISLSKQLCRTLPKDFEKDLLGVLNWKRAEEVLPAVKSLIQHLDKMLLQVEERK